MKASTGIFALAGLTLAFHGARAQQAADGPRFDVVSVKMIDRGSVHQPRETFREDSGRIDYQMVGMRELVLRAFRLPDYKVVWPKWIADLGRSSNIDRYNIAATMPNGTTDKQRPQMLQQLLAERFGLVVHRETKPVQVYSTVVSKSGLKIKKAPDPTSDTYRGPMLSSAGWHVSGDYRIAQLITFFSGELDRPLIDDTGLEGYYHADLTWERPMQVGRGFPAPTVEGPPIASTPEGGYGPSLFSAMERQLGLGVEKRSVPTELLVIDHLDRVPTGN